MKNGRQWFILGDMMEESSSVQDEAANRKCPAIKWTKWAGIATFMFFLLKGLAWLIVPAVIYYFASSE